MGSPVFASLVVSYMKAIDFSRVIEYYMHMNNTSVTPILLTYIEHLVLSHSPTH